MREKWLHGSQTIRRDRIRSDEMQAKEIRETFSLDADVLLILSHFIAEMFYNQAKGYKINGKKTQANVHTNEGNQS